METERLIMRPLANADLDEYAAIMADEEVVRYLGSAPLTREEAWRSMAGFLGHEVLRGYTNYAVVEKASGRLLGRAGLWNPEGWPGLEVGWAFGRFAWGQGFATEVGVAWRDQAFETLGADDLCSVVHRDAERSAAVARRIGHGYLREIEIRGFPCILWGQTRAEWEARR